MWLLADMDIYGMCISTCHPPEAAAQQSRNSIEKFDVICRGYTDISGIYTPTWHPPGGSKNIIKKFDVICWGYMYIYISHSPNRAGILSKSWMRSAGTWYKLCVARNSQHAETWEQTKCSQWLRFIEIIREKIATRRNARTNGTFSMITFHWNS